MKIDLLAIFLLLLGSCNSSAVFEEYKEFTDEEWSRFDVVEFTANVPDSGLYHVVAGVRHSMDYELANLWCFLSTRGSAAEQYRDSINFKLAEADGRWLGQGGRIKTVLAPLNKNPLLLPRGKVVFRLEQGMRQENLRGVKNIGLVIEKVK